MLVATCTYQCNPRRRAARNGAALRRDRALGSEGWRNAADEPTQDNGLGFYVASLNVAYLPRSASEASPSLELAVAGKG